MLTIKVGRRRTASQSCVPFMLQMVWWYVRPPIISEKELSKASTGGNRARSCGYHAATMRVTCMADDVSNGAPSHSVRYRRY